MKRKLIYAARAAALTAGAVLVALGLSGGEFASVMQKAVRICLECIGIG